MRATEGRGVDVVLELVGGPYLAEDLVCAASRARIVLVGMMGGTSAELDQTLIMRKRLTIMGTQLRNRPLGEKIAAGQMFAHHIVPLVASGALQPIVERVLPLAEAATAHQLMAANEGFGKLVLSVD